ncbi:hypothetical protein QTP88_022204 [Uroleucon formosanum]
MIKYKVPNVSYVHCCAHNLNLVISDAAKCSPKVASFFDTIQAIYNFFSGSAPRWAILAFGEDQSKRIKTKVLKKFCPTRWESRHESLYALKSRFIDVLKALTNMSLTSTKTEERNISLSLKKKLESVEFVLLLCLWEHILRPLHVVSKILQNPNTNLHSACRNLKNAKEVIQNLRNYYEITILSECKHLCVKLGISMNFHVRRQKSAVKHFDEVEGDRRLSISDENFRVKIVLPVIDMVLFQLNLRFEGLRKSDISSDFTRQLLCMKDQLIPQKIKSIKELTLNIIKNNLCITFFDVLSACIIYLTLPVTVASAERSFSKLKLIKNYLRNNMGQDRLSNIAVLNIEKDVAAKIKLDHVINTFGNSKARKFPTSKEEWKEIAQLFEERWNFPHCIGALDGKHINIVPPAGSGSEYFNYKGHHSMVLLGLVNANYQFMLVDFGTNGRISDGDILKPLRQSLLDSREKKIFNYRLSRARRIVENAFGILASRFRVFHTEINMEPKNIEKIVMTSCALHNFLIENSPTSYAPQKCFYQEDIENGSVTTNGYNVEKSNIYNLDRRNPGNIANTAKQVRENFMNYFCDEGIVPWQNKFIG